MAGKQGCYWFIITVSLFCLTLALAMQGTRACTHQLTDGEPVAAEGQRAPGAWRSLTGVKSWRDARACALSLTPCCHPLSVQEGTRKASSVNRWLVVATLKSRLPPPPHRLPYSAVDSPSFAARPRHPGSHTASGRLIGMLLGTSIA